MQRYYFICNPASNTGKLSKEWEDFLLIVEAKIPGQYEWVYTEHEQHAEELVVNAYNTGYRNIIAVGGDGMANTIANAIIKNELDVVFGMLPFGTSNDTHSSLDLPKDREQSLDIIIEGYSESFAVGKATYDSTYYYFIDHIDSGIGSLTAQSALSGSKLIKGEFKYTYYAIKNILKFKRNKGTLIVDGKEQTGEYTLISAALGRTMGGYKVWPDNSHRMKDFAFCITKGQSKFALLKLLLATKNGEHIGNSGVEYTRGTSLQVKLERPWPYQAEGEIFTNGTTNLTIQYIPDALQIFYRKLN